MTDAELISRYLAGDLPPDAAHTVRGRLDAEPELRALRAALLAMDQDFARLPVEVPPPGLDAAVLARLDAPPVPTRKTPRIAWMALGLAAGIALTLGVRAVSIEPEQTLKLDSGTVTVDGNQSITTGSARVRVEGHAAVTASARWVEVKVLDGRARIDGNMGVTWIYAGQTRRVGDPTPAHVPQPPAASEDLAELRSEIMSLRQQSAADQRMLDMAKGRLALLEGAPQSWPSGIADALRPDAFAAHAALVASRTKGFRVTDVICDEYPCIAVFAGPPAAAAGDVEALIGAMQEGAPEGADRWQTRADRVDDERGPDLLVLALSVANGPASPDLDARVKYRIEGEVQSALEELP